MRAIVLSILVVLSFLLGEICNPKFCLQIGLLVLGLIGEGDLAPWSAMLAMAAVLVHGFEKRWAAITSLLGALVLVALYSLWLIDAKWTSITFWWLVPFILLSCFLVERCIRRSRSHRTPV